METVYKKIPVTGELKDFPEKDTLRKDLNVSIPVIVICDEGSGHSYCAFYDFENKIWYGRLNYNHLIGITHWLKEVPLNQEWIDIENERFQWSLETFKEATSISSLRKAEQEIKEIEQNILNNVKDPEEYADVLMCIIDSAGREGITLSDILSAYKQKVEINKSRDWIKNPDNSYSHVPKTS